MVPAWLCRQTFVGGPPCLACLGRDFHLACAPGRLKGLRKPAGIRGKPAEARDDKTLGIGYPLTSLTPLGTTPDRPKPSGICEEEALGAGIARK